MKIADLYIRVSTDEQADKGYSQRAQEDVLMKYCEINGIKVRDIILEDYSAKTFERPAWRKLLEQIKKSKGKTNLILFTKWDRFSRNASDAYQMISTLHKFGVDPQAIEQPLDMNIPENKMMLAVYLTAPEIENDRRALNVKHGMRQAKKEGRWMATAPPGYLNKTTEIGKKYIGIDEQQAEHVRFAFEEFGKGIYTATDVFSMAKKRGLRSNRSYFWKILRNVAYMGKILVPAYRNEEAYLVQGQHEPLISEALFYKVQDILEGRNKRTGPIGAKKEEPNELVLRGFLICPLCGRLACGSPSKGRYKYYWYYHCVQGCKWRQRADKLNGLFIEELRKYVPKKGAEEIFTIAATDFFRDGQQQDLKQKKEIITQITEQNNKITKARELLLNGDIEADDFKKMKKNAEDNILRLEAILAENQHKKSDHSNVSGLIYHVIENLKNLYLMYIEADIEKKRRIIGSLFPEKLVFDNDALRTTKINQAMNLIYQINSELEGRKIKTRADKSPRVFKVHPIGFEPMTYGLERHFVALI
jgi:site-specific DNA recombinase